MVRFALAGVSGMTRSAIAAFLLPPPGVGDCATGDCAGAGVTAGAAEGATLGDESCDGRDRMTTNAITASSTIAPAAIAAIRRMPGDPSLTSCVRAAFSAGAI